VGDLDIEGEMILFFFKRGVISWIRFICSDHW